jgi:WD40 repeat protein
MPIARSTIRLFVSSTFSDMEAERDALQREVFPRLRQLCLSNGLRFQPIDLRWGVPEEAGKDNRTMRICLRELRRCQEMHPKPNFLILLGDRYGWRPLPEIIPADLFAQLLNQVPRAAQELLEWRETQATKGWYRRDDNSVPPVYELQPRGDDEEWHRTVEKPLLDALVAAARALGFDPERRGVAIGTSATEQEIVEGALKVDDAAEHVHAFFRSIIGLPHARQAEKFVDLLDDGRRDPIAAVRQGALKARIAAKIGESNIHRYEVHWREGMQPHDLTQFTADAYAALKGVILCQVAELTSVSREAEEEAAHRAFGEERRRGFIGRRETLAHMVTSLGEGAHRILAVLGPSGAGKSALMAEAVRLVRLTHGENAVIARFIGGTPDSANITALLRNLVAEIRRRYPAPVPVEGEPSVDREIPLEINPLIAVFHEALAKPTAERPLFIFLDALDQLTAGHGALEGPWLPSSLSPHVRLIVSAPSPADTDHAPPQRRDAADTSARAHDPRAAVVSTLNRRASEIQQILVEPLSMPTGQALADQWLADAGRTLQPRQMAAILASFRQEGLPLWLRVAVGQCGRLASWGDTPRFDPTLPALLTHVLDGLSAEVEHGAVLVERALGSLASARHGLAEDELIDLLSADREVIDDLRRRSPRSPRNDALPLAVWARLHGDIGPYLTTHQSQDADLLNFYHGSFLDAVQATFLNTAERRGQAHRHVAEHFASRAWFIAPVDSQGVAQRDGVLTDQPNVRKASELPWQLLRRAEASDPAREKPAEWDAALAVLCDMTFLEVKCRGGLVLELEEDYRAARTALPEAQAMRRDDQERTETLARWTDALIRYSQAWTERRHRIARNEAIDELEPALSEPPVSCRIWTDQEIEAECRRQREQPTRLDRLTAFSGFLQSESSAVMAFGTREGFVLQHAHNVAPGGPVHDAAAELVPQHGVRLLLRRWPGEARWNPKPAMLRALEGHGAGVVTADGRRVVFGSVDGVEIWDLEFGTLTRSIRIAGERRRLGETNPVDMTITPDGRRAVMAMNDRTLQVWDLERGACVRSLGGNGHRVTSVSVTADGSRAVTSTENSSLYVWDLDSGTCLHAITAHSVIIGTELTSTIVADGRWAVTGGSDKTVRVWDLDSGACLRTFNSSDYVRAVTTTADGGRVLSGGLNGTLELWDLESGTLIRTLDNRKETGGGYTVNSLSVTADGRHAVSGSFDNALRIWDLDSGECLRILKGHSAEVSRVSVSADGRRAVSASGRDGTLRVWDLQTGLSPRTILGHPRQVTGISITPDGLRVISGSHDGSLRVWDAESGVCLRTFPGSGLSVSGVSVTLDGHRAICSHDDGALWMWDLESGACRPMTFQELLVPSETFEREAMALDRGRAVWRDAQDEMRVVDVETAESLRRLQGHARFISPVRVSPDGLRAVSGSDDNTLRVWDLESGQCIALAHSRDPITALTIYSGRSVNGPSNVSDRICYGTRTGDIVFLD